MRNLGVRVERADVRWVGARRKKSTQCGWAFELILLFTSVDGLFCLGTRETITTSTVDTIPLLAPPRSSKHLPLLNVVILLFTDMWAMQHAGPNAIHQIRRQYAGGESP